jgi:hypothetical protein
MKENKKIRKLIDQLFTPILIISIILISSTLITYYAEFRGDNSTFIKAFLNWFDLNQSGNAAIWLSVIIWLICGMSFSILGLSKTVNSKISLKNRVFLIIFSLFVCLLSIEKIFEFHLMIDFRAINFLGFFSKRLQEGSHFYWLFLLIIPIFLMLVVNFLVIYYKLLNGISPTHKLRVIAKSLFISALLCIPLVILFDVLQGYYWRGGMQNTVFNSLEESIELVGLSCFIGCNKFIASYYDV